MMPTESLRHPENRRDLATQLAVLAGPNYSSTPADDEPFGPNLAEDSRLRAGFLHNLFHDEKVDGVSDLLEEGFRIIHEEGLLEPARSSRLLGRLLHVTSQWHESGVPEPDTHRYTRFIRELARQFDTDQGFLALYDPVQKTFDIAASSKRLDDHVYERLPARARNRSLVAWVMNNKCPVHAGTSDEIKRRTDGWFYDPPGWHGSAVMCVPLLVESGLDSRGKGETPPERQQLTPIGALFFQSSESFSTADFILLLSVARIVTAGLVAQRRMRGLHRAAEHAASRFSSRSEDDWKKLVKDLVEQALTELRVVNCGLVFEVSPGSKIELLASSHDKRPSPSAVAAIDLADPDSSLTARATQNKRGQPCIWHTEAAYPAGQSSGTHKVVEVFDGVVSSITFPIHRPKRRDSSETDTESETGTDAKADTNTGDEHDEDAVIGVLTVESSAHLTTEDGTDRPYRTSDGDPLEIRLDRWSAEPYFFAEFSDVAFHLRDLANILGLVLHERNQQDKWRRPAMDGTPSVLGDFLVPQGNDSLRDSLEEGITLAARSGTVFPSVISGPTGTGKTLIAKAIHKAASAAAEAKFVQCDLTALSPTLIEAELFGFVKGAFTGASKDRDGLLALADGGTLFIDELQNLGEDILDKLLVFLQERTFRPVGSVKEKSSSARLIFGTQATTLAEIEPLETRTELQFRIIGRVIKTPDLGSLCRDEDQLRDFVNLLGTRLARRLQEDPLYRTSA